MDAQKDIALASLGALITMSGTAIVNAVSQRDFAAEWIETLGVHRPQPLGEVELRRRREEAALH